MWNGTATGRQASEPRHASGVALTEAGNGQGGLDVGEG